MVTLTWWILSFLYCPLFTLSFVPSFYSKIWPCFWNFWWPPFFNWWWKFHFVRFTFLFFSCFWGGAIMEISFMSLHHGLYYGVFASNSNLTFMFWMHFVDSKSLARCYHSWQLACSNTYPSSSFRKPEILC
mgnify:CR=1 FL=1